MGRKWCQNDPLFLVGGKRVQADTAIFADPDLIVPHLTQAVALEVRRNTGTTVVRDPADTTKDLAGRDFAITYIVDNTIAVGAVKIRSKWFTDQLDAETGRDYSTLLMLDPLAPSTSGSAQTSGRANGWTGNAQVTP